VVIDNELTFSSINFEVHARRLQALKALTYAPSNNSDILSRLYEIVFGILHEVCPTLISSKNIYLENASFLFVLVTRD
jgi:hypothetical protein